MGATDPKKADKGTIRADFAESSTPTPCMVPMHRKPLPWKSLSSSRHEHLRRPLIESRS